MGLTFSNSNGSSGRFRAYTTFLSSDPDVNAFLSATGITDITIATAVGTLVQDLKGYGIWTKMKALYPFVGGTATTHKFNLKNPADANVAFRLVFNGGWTHSATGALPNGTNAYADTFLAPIPVLTENNTHLSYYSRTNVNGQEVEIGCYAGSRFAMQMRYSGVFGSDNYANWSAARVSVSNSDSRGFYIGTRTAINSHKAFKNGPQYGATNTNDPGSMAALTNNIFIGATNNTGNPSLYSAKEVAFASIGDGLTDTEAANYYTAVQAFQTTLGRQV